MGKIVQHEHTRGVRAYVNVKIETEMNNVEKTVVYTMKRMSH